jgi:type II secretory pathway component PulK
VIRGSLVGTARRRRLASIRGPVEDRRGIALILALVMVVLMTAFAVEFNYNTHVQNLSAYHYRDSTRSYYLAKGGLRIYGMLLIFGRQLEGNQMIAAMIQQFGLNIDGAAMLCRSVPFLDTAMLRYLTGTGGSVDDEEKEGLMGLLGLGGDESDETITPPPLPSASDQAAARDRRERAERERGYIDETDEGGSERRRLMDFEGDFKVDCADESSKVDINGFSSNTWASRPLEQHPTAMMLFGMMSPEEYDPLFEERLKMDRWELIANIKDWVDPDTQRSGLWGGDEDSLYDDFDPRYRSKNTRFDSLEELRLVAGVNDEVYETWAPSLSVHTKNYKVNVNSASPQMIRSLIRAFTDPMLVPDIRLDTEVVPLLIAERMFLPGPFRNGTDFINRVKAKGIVFDPAAEQALKGLVTTKSRVFRLTATGYVNESTSTIETTIRVNSSSIRTLEWRER